MKEILLGVSLLLPGSTTFAQGTVVFVNSPTTLVSVGGAGQSALISGPPGSYYFALLIAPPGTADASQFAFTGVYATNTATPGRIGPSSYTPSVPGWPVAVDMSFLVAGWSSSLGHDWNQQWMSASFGAFGYFGFSTIGIGTTGGPGAGGPPVADLNLFGGLGIQTGWNLDPVPEPSTVVLLALGAFGLILRRHAAGGRPAENESGECGPE